MTTWMERFRESLAAMCGSVPPLEFCEEWVEGIQVNGADRLQNWVFSKGNRAPKWAQAIVIIDAAQLLADQPEEGAGHLDKDGSDFRWR